VRVKVTGCNVDLYFTTDSGATPPTHGATGTTDAMGYPLLDGTWEEFYITNHTHLAWDADDAGVLTLLRCGMERVRHES
jgi:hypothetical protein